jgi:hypothetical protein
MPIARKSDVREVLKDVLGKWELKTGKRVITIRSDRGGKYIDGELKKDLRELHIVGVRSQFCSFVFLCCYLTHSTYAAYCNTCAVAMKACAE